MFKPRPAQAEILAYTHGRMGISAVPGSGKTHTLSRLAADLIIAGRLDDNQEILVVTMVNSAVQVFSRRIAEFVTEAGLLPDIGYRVRTLHGLAHDIIRERPSLVGLPERFTIIAEREATSLLERSCMDWLDAHREFRQHFSKQLDDSSNVSNQDWQKLVISIAGAFIRQAKDEELEPDDVEERLQSLGDCPYLVQLGVDIYRDYRKKLAYRSGVDFDDLIRLANKAIHSDRDYLLRLQQRFPYILEDEAQDSSRLQQCILETLTGLDGNWVRVGDPNQAIYETFTTASPEHLRAFLTQPDVLSLTLPNSGRSTLSIIKLANHLIQWASTEHPVTELRRALTYPLIEPTPPGDPQPNPPDIPNSIFFSKTSYSPDEEIDILVKSIERWLPLHSEETIAVLTPSNERGEKVAEALEARGIPCLELLRFTQPMREATGQLTAILDSLSNPTDARRLARVLISLPDGDLPPALAAADQLRKCSHLEDFLNPRPGSDWLQAIQSDLPVDALPILEVLRNRFNRWHAATALPIDQLILTIALDIYSQPGDLAFCHRVAMVLGQTADGHPGEDLGFFASELKDILRQQRGIFNASEDESQFDPSAHKGVVVIATMHKAKGLEWDRVYLLSVNSYDFPSGQDGDSYRSERYFVRDNLNLEAEALAQLRAIVHQDEKALHSPLGYASSIDRFAVASERLRLFYVAITRARKELVVMTNTGRNKDKPPALAFTVLRDFWESNP